MTPAHCLLALIAAAAVPQELPAPAQSARSVIAAAKRQGAAFPEELSQKLADENDPAAVWQAVKPHTLIEVVLNPEMRVKVAAGPAKPRLLAGEAKAFFVRVENQCGTTAQLNLEATDLASADAGTPDWLEIAIVDAAGQTDRLSGAAVEYKLLICRVKEPGRKEVRLGLDAGQGTQDIGFRGVTDILFHVQPRKQANPFPGE